jgi:hypothetical protein
MLSLEAAFQSDITRSSIAQAMAALAKEGGGMAQMAFAWAADVSQEWVNLCPNATEEVRP